MTDAFSEVRNVVFLGHAGMGLLDLSGAQSVFWTASRALQKRGRAGYRCSTASIGGGLLVTAEGVAIDSQPIDAVQGLIDTLVVPGGPDILRGGADKDALVDWLAHHAGGIRRTVAVCTGTFLLAQAGLLRGQRATTHWAMCDLLQAQFPGIEVDRQSLFVQQGGTWTSGGVTAGIDLALALVEADGGRDIAMQVARELLVFLKRPGGQPQCSEMLASQSTSCDTFDDLHFWLADNLANDDLTVGRLAGRMNMSPRNFTRLYKKKIGRTPAKTVELFRVGAAQRMLQDSHQSIEQIAAACGFGDQERMRVTFHRHLEVSPREYRNRFQ
ncbi:GlxA family transcriptional regulator [Pseudomonas sp. NPDC090202]|uniref:GlxA family transcriptional regulator n=1 Tax=unclassified Pseudomonas TaxID=196821 RepID=UPI00381CF240